MRLIHCADIHLDSPMTSRLSADKAAQRRMELLETFCRMIDYAGNNGVSAVLIAGDMFDGDIVSTTTRAVVNRAIGSHKDIDFYILCGNHDRSNFWTDMESVPDNVHFFDEEWTRYPIGEGISLYGLQYGGRHGDIYDSLTMNESDINIVMLHGQVADDSSAAGTDIVNVRKLRNRGIDYLALGHIHSYRREELDNRGIYCYSGCLEARGYDEAGVHGFVLLDIDTASGRIESRLVPFAKRELYELDVDITGTINVTDVIACIEEQLEVKHVKTQDIVRIVLKGQISVDSKVDTDYIRHLFESEFYSFDIRDVSSHAVDIEDYIYDESLKGEFVRLVMAAEDICEADKGEVIMKGLMAIRGEAESI